MRKNLLLPLFTLMSFFIFVPHTVAQDLSKFYSYRLTPAKDGYIAYLNGGFKYALSSKYHETYSDGKGYTWETGDPLPNPAPNGKYNGPDGEKDVVDFGYFFSEVQAKTLDLSLFDTSNVKNFSAMFMYCYTLTYLNLKGWDTSKATCMDFFLYNCGKLEFIDVSTFDTSNVTNMNAMFKGCRSLTSLDLSNFNTSKVTYMSSMFRDCSGLTNLNISSFDTSNVTDMQSMFNGCSSLTSLNTSSFNTSKVTNMKTLFTYCSNLVSLELNSFDTSHVTNMSAMFMGCSNLTLLDISSFKFSSNTNAEYMLSDAGKILNNMKCYCFVKDYSTKYYLKKHSMDRCENINLGYAPDINKFYDYTLIDSLGGYKVSLTKKFKEALGSSKGSLSSNGYTWKPGIPLPNPAPNGKHNSQPVVSMSYLLYESNLQSANLCWFNTSNVIDMSKMFGYCKKLTSIDMSSFDTSKVKYMKGMFNQCGSLENPIFGNKFTTAQVTDMTDMFENCESLKSIDLSNFDTSNVTTMSYLFANCYKLESLDLSSFKTSKVQDMNGMFSGCRSLTSLDLSNFDTSNTSKMNSMFEDCSSLTYIDMSNFDFPSMFSVKNIFLNCGKPDNDNIPAIGVVANIENAYNLNNLMFTSISPEKLKIGMKYQNDNINYALFLTFDGKSATVIHSDDYSGDIVIPAAITTLNSARYPIRAIAPKAFANCTEITSIDARAKENGTDQSMIKHIGSEAFSGCSNLHTIGFGKYVDSIGDKAFFGTTNLEELLISTYSAPDVYPTTFDDSNYTNTYLSTYSSSLPNYRNHEIWKKLPVGPSIPGFTGVTHIATNPIKVTKLTDGIRIDGTTEGTPINIYTIDGRLIKSTQATSAYTDITGIPHTLHIIQIGTQVIKTAM